jgi:ABC-type bacteriocin/lantibiotic exporter with double-glycine peptidase domain
MEIFRKYIKLNLKKQVTVWSWLGRVAPLTALFVICLMLFFDVDTWTETVLILIAILFSITAFTWWWWVIYAVRDIFTMLNQANKKFTQVLSEIKQIKIETNKLKRPKK